MKKINVLRPFATVMVSTAVAMAVGVISFAAPTTAEARDRITCESVNNNRSYCRANTSGGAHLQTQLSKAGCIQGSTWGVNGSRGIWVSNGCRGVFVTGSNTYSDSHHSSDGDKAAAAIAAAALIAVGAKAAHDRHDDYRRSSYGDNYYSYNYNDNDYHDYRYRSTRNIAVTCESHNDSYQYCRAPVNHRHVRLLRRFSSSGCEFHRDWGYDRSGIWVENGCRATFEIE